MIGRRSLFGVVLAAGLLAAAWMLGDYAPDVPRLGAHGRHDVVARRPG